MPREMSEVSLLETTPLRHFWLSTRSSSVAADSSSSPRSLSTFFGVFVPCVLSMFSVILYLRLGFIIGNAGLIQTLTMFVLAYFIVLLTVLSICAISTNGAIEGGGAYFMISRALGPEFGGSIGIMFFFANIFSSALYVIGLTESLVDMFSATGTFGQLLENYMPQAKWWQFLYASLILLFIIFICLIGASLFAKTSFFIFLIVMVSVCSIILSFFIVREQISVTIVDTQYCSNISSQQALYLGLGKVAFQQNIFANYTQDCTTGQTQNFILVFAILFNGVTGIMAGANMSGELKNPSKSIPQGTLLACFFTFSVYVILSIFISGSCSRFLLQYVFGFLSYINVWPPLVSVGIIAATLSAALTNLIGASRILYALAKDDLFGIILKPVRITVGNENPIVAVLVSWFLVQLVLFMGELNTIAPIVSIFFLLSYAAVNIACLALEWASAPNFRPSFSYYSWHTCFLGMTGCVVMMFLIQPLYAALSLVLVTILFAFIHYRAPDSSWGYISQALIFHQVRKYLLMLDVRKDHVKFWRPQMLLLVANPRSACQLMRFVNDIKKSGLYVVGHVRVGQLDAHPSDPLQTEYPAWLSLVEELKVKAFVELTLADSVRAGVQHLIRIAGLGGMKPNTVVMGFHDNCLPQDSFAQAQVFRRSVKFESDQEVSTTERRPEDVFEPIRGFAEERCCSLTEYVTIIGDAIKLNKNVCLARYFHELNMEKLLAGPKGTPVFIDVWPVNFFKPETSGYLDTACLFLLQLACIITMVPAWKRRASLRVFLCVDAVDPATRSKEARLRRFLDELRISAHIKIVTWEHVTCLLAAGQAPESEEAEGASTIPPAPPSTYELGDPYLRGINELVKQQTANTALTFCYLPLPPADALHRRRYLKQLEMITDELPPTFLVHGISAVTSTTL